ncbi:ParB N-terminal domain-containing protein [Caballeronia sp. SBC2]|uniref:ParB/RepB/Spo0J family partition protein n=1 Tax=Caballeronia sp. SBC2 TaxID=2705547 RepID=UPI0013E205E2|nr:ParB N-terminal domain-containing protein [Caballeronia sp. SBC2]QIE30293.1 Nucleoid occlusion protein [Caballeronia sp. SBC2]
MSWIKDQAAKASNIQLTEADHARASAAKSGGPRTAPGQLMNLQATAAAQREEIERLKIALQGAAKVKLPVSRLHEVPHRRRRLTAEQYGELKANLEKYPLSTPVSVEVRADGDWNIIAGNNRVAVYRELGREEIEANVLDIESSLVERVAFFSNLLSPSLSDFEKYWNFKRLQEDTELNRKELAEAAGLAESHVSRIFAFEGLPDEAKEILAERPERLGSHAAAKLASAAAAGRSTEVTEAVRRLVDDVAFTQENAVKYAISKPQGAERNIPTPLLVKVGKKKFCEITTRNGVIGVKLNDEADQAEQWAKDIQRFIESTLKSRG